MDRVEVIKRLNEFGYYSIPEDYICKVADFIIADRQRICSPLVKARNDRTGSTKLLYESIDETLKLAAIL